MSDRIGPMTNSLINEIISEINKKETKDKIIRKCIDPLLCNITSRYYNYFIMIIVVMLLIILLLISILIMIIYKK